MAKKKIAPSNALDLVDQQLAALRMEAINVAARLPEPEPGMHGGMMSGHMPGRPGKSADKVIADAEKIVAFVTKRA